MKLTTQNIEKYLDNPKKKFKIFNLPLTKKELTILSDLKLPKNTTSFIHFGKEEDIKNLDDFLLSLGDNSPEHIEFLEKKIREIFKIVVKGYNLKDAVFLINSTYKDPSFDIRRWHTDGFQFPRYKDEIQSKFVMVLKGMHTLLLEETEKEKKFYLDMINKELEEEKMYLPYPFEIPEWKDLKMRYRKILDKKFKNSKIIQPLNSQGFIFLNHPGNLFEYGAIHSEPKKDDYRMFISILPGTEEEIKHKKNRTIGTAEEKESAHKLFVEEVQNKRYINKPLKIIKSQDGGDNNYYQKYVKYKTKYLEQKV
jgi:hypothetical protein